MSTTPHHRTSRSPFHRGPRACWGPAALETPDLPRIPWRMEDGVKVFHLTCDVVERRFVPWSEPFNIWGYNGSMPGPTIEVVAVGARNPRPRRSECARSLS